ncbi:MAG: hypothetical protein ACRC35_05110 [Angustibacter sp.]
MLTPVHRDRTPTRRQALQALSAGVSTAALSTGCGVRFGQPGDSQPAPGSEAGRRQADRDRAGRTRAASQADELAAALTGAADVLTEWRDRLLPLASQHQQHADALRAVSPRSGRDPATGTAPTGSSPSGSSRGPERTTGPTSAPRTLITQLRSLIKQLRGAAGQIDPDLPQVSPATARVLASVRASRLQQADLLARWAR